MSRDRSNIAIVGMACKFPGAPDLETYRSNLERGVDAIIDAPPGRVDPAYYEPGSTANDRITCRRGGFLGEAVFFDPTPYGIMPIAAEGSEPDQMLTLELVAAALKDAGFELDSSIPRETTAVILGRGGYIGSRGARLCQHAIFAQQLAKSAAALLPGLTSDHLNALKEGFISQLGHYGSDTAIGLVPNIVASLVANRFDFGGSAYTIDAACASSLIAVDQAIRELHAGSADLVVTGGIHLCDDMSFWNVFSRLGAISRTQQIRPFDRRADGLLIGEGIGILVLARQADAERRGDRIYALIQGVGVSSDGRGRSVMQPRTTGQIVALDRAWRMAGLNPGSIGLLEAHGTGTPEGDRAELATIAQFFGDKLESQAALGTVKSMIGHTMPAAGAAGLIKAALAIYHGFLPPTLHCEEPSELVARTGFQLLTESIPWPDGVARRAAVNAFGFGGINAHLVLEAASELPRVRHATGDRSFSDMLLLSAQSPDDLLRMLEGEQLYRESGPFRLAIERPTPERRLLGAKLVRRGMRWGGRNGIWYSPGGLAQEGGRIAFLYPGMDASFEPNIQGLADYLGIGTPPYHDARGDLLTVSYGIISLGRWLTDILEHLGIHAHGMAGHSVGEWTGMMASGLIESEGADRFFAQVAPALELNVPGVVFAAAGCGVAQGEEAISGLPEISVSHDNCPHQILLCGVENSIEIAMGRLRAAKILCEKLPFRSGFHSPLLRPYVRQFYDIFQNFTYSAPKVPLWSANTLEPYPLDREAKNRLLVEHLLERVRFRELIDRLHETGHRVFIQIGMGRLVGFVEDTLSGRPFMASSVLAEKRDGLEQVRRLSAELWCEGYPVRLDRIGLKLTQSGLGEKKGKAIRLELATPHPHLKPSPEILGAAGVSRSSDTVGVQFGSVQLDSNPVLRELATVNQALSNMSQEVVAAWSERSRSIALPQPVPQALSPRSLVRVARYSLETMPEVIDHCFIRQPKGWNKIVDRFPVVPMTRSIDTLLELAHELVPELIPIEVERIRANRWLELEPPVDVELKAKFDGKDRVRISIGDYLEGTVVLAEEYPPAPPPRPLDLSGGVQPCVSIKEYYEGWTFHGPAFQGITRLGPMGESGMHGDLVCLPARGALLDAGGQLAGYWCAAHIDRDRVVLPYRIDRVRYFGPHPHPGTRMAATVHIHELTDLWQRADVEFHDNNLLWARMEGLEDRRFQGDDRFYFASQFPGTKYGALIRSQGYCLVEESWRTSASRYFIARLYLGDEEMAEYRGKQMRVQRAWLLGRIALKDVVRNLLWERGVSEIYPIQIQVRNIAQGRPYVTGFWQEDLRVSVAHKESIAVAIVAEGADVGIDLEKIEHRDNAFVTASFQPRELNLVKSVDRDEWLTRLWVAKEAIGKARGTGLAGQLHNITIEKIEGERLFADGVWVSTVREGDYIVGWTEHPTIWHPKNT